MSSCRGLAAEAIAGVLERNGSLASLLPKAIQQCPEPERALLQQLCYGTCRFLPSLSLITDSLLNKPIGKKDQDIHGLILVGLYQLIHSQVPPHAAIDETVEAAEALSKPWAKALVNGILRSYQREEGLIQSLSNRPEVRYHHPQWIIDRCKAGWPDHWEHILEQNNQQGPMTLRINTSQISREDYFNLLTEAEIKAQICQFADSAITLDAATDVYQLPGFEEGMVSVQDEAAQLAAGLMNLQPGQTVLDACAAPGGKTCHLLEREPQLASVLALDQSAERLERVEENLERLNLSNVGVMQGDASSTAWWEGEQFDRILADVPCSATGVIRRNPDIKYLRVNKDIQALSKLQERIVKNLWPMLKPGGRMVYATCSIFIAENESVIKRVLKSLPDAQEIQVAADWGIERPHGRQLFPQAHGHDGFYYAVLEKCVTD